MPARAQCLKARSAYSICREWRQVHLKAEYETSLLDEGDEMGTNRIMTVADATKRELEDELEEDSIATGDDLGAVLGVALRLIEDGADDRAAVVMRVARKAAFHVGDAAARRA